MCFSKEMFSGDNASWLAKWMMIDSRLYCKEVGCCDDMIIGVVCLLNFY